MSQYNGNGNGSASISFPPFSELIEEYCDRNPKERSKFVCPVCNGGNLSVNMKTGKWDCLSEQSADHRQEICTELNGRYKAEHPELAVSKNGGGKYKAKTRTERQVYAAKTKAASVAAAIAASEVETKVEELTAQLDPTIKRGTVAYLQMEMAEWAKAHGHDVFSAKTLLTESIKRAIAPLPHSAPQGSATHSNTGSQSVLTSHVAGGATQRERDDFSQMEEMASTTFDPALMLPHTLAVDMARDAQLLAIDPVSIWVYLMPAVASMMGKITIDFSGWKVPNIIWSVIAQKSGRGKTRAMGLVTAPLWDLEASAEEDFQAAMKQYKSDIRSAAKNGDEDPEKPIRKKFLFNIATPQAVVKRISEQDRGVLWSRDELKGMMEGLKPIGGKSEGEGLEILLETWDGKAAQVDRVDTENSFFVAESRLSVAGGFQPKIFRSIADPDDPQGVLARMLVAVPKDIPYVRHKGHPVLGSKLKDLYAWVDSMDWSGLTPTVEADDLLTTIAEYYNNAPAPNDALDNWQKKAAGQCIRVAGVLHVLECFYSSDKNKKLITRDTLMKAYYYVSLCHKWLYALQGMTNESSSVSSLLQKIIDRTKACGGAATMADIYRNIRPVRVFAKDEGLSISEATILLCKDLESMGKGILSPDEKGKLKFEILATPATQNAESLTPPVFEPCGGTESYRHSPPPRHKEKSTSKKEGESNPPVEVGMEVSILDATSPHKGSIGEIRELITLSTGETVYRVVRDYEGTPEQNFEAVFSRQNIRPLAKKNNSWEPV